MIMIGATIIHIKRDAERPDRDSNLTLGKTYSILPYDYDDRDNFYAILDDRGAKVTKWKWKFSTPSLLDEELFIL